MPTGTSSTNISTTMAIRRTLPNISSPSPPAGPRNNAARIVAGTTLEWYLWQLTHVLGLLPPWQATQLCRDGVSTSDVLALRRACSWHFSQSMVACLPPCWNGTPFSHWRSSTGGVMARRLLASGRMSWHFAHFVLMTCSALMTLRSSALVSARFARSEEHTSELQSPYV